MGRRAERRRVARRGGAGRGRRGGVDLPARVVARRHALLRLRPQQLVEPLPARRGRRGRACVREGGRVRHAAVGLRHVGLLVRVRRADSLRLQREGHVEPRHARHEDRTARTHRDALHRNLLRQGGGRPRRLPRRVADEPPGRRRGRPQERRAQRAAPRERSRRGRRLSFDPARGRVPDRERPHRARLLLPAAQPRLRGARGRAPAARRPLPRRPDRDDHHHAPPRHAVLDEPRRRRARRELRRQHRLRARVPQASERAVGRGGRGRLRERRAPPHRAGRGGRRALRHHGRERGRLHDA